MSHTSLPYIALFTITSLVALIPGCGGKVEDLGQTGTALTCEKYFDGNTPYFMSEQVGKPVSDLCDCTLSSWTCGDHGEIRAQLLSDPSVTTSWTSCEPRPFLDPMHAPLPGQETAQSAPTAESTACTADLVANMRAFCGCNPDGTSKS